MSTETMLLSELIREAPNGSSWLISSDSWEEIETIFASDIETKESYWAIVISDINKMNLRHAIEKDDLGDKIIHTQIISREGTKLFYSYDRMAMTTINASVYNGDFFIRNYPDIEIYLE